MLDPITHRHRLLIARDLIAIPPAAGAPAAAASLVTVAANIAHYGYALSADAYAAFNRLGDTELASWWAEVEIVLAALTGADKKMEAFVVYKNFPAEVLAMDQVEYWTRQILMYWGLPNEMLTQPEVARARLTEKPALVRCSSRVPIRCRRSWRRCSRSPRVGSRPSGRMRDTSSVRSIARSISPSSRSSRIGSSSPRSCSSGARASVSRRRPMYCVSRPASPMVTSACASRASCASCRAASAATFWRCSSGRRTSMRTSHGAASSGSDCCTCCTPGDYRDKFPRVVAAYDKLYNTVRLPTFNAQLEQQLEKRDHEALELLRTRPGVFARRLHESLLAFGPDAVRAFNSIVGELKTIQLLKLHRYLETIGDRAWRMFPPRGNWSKVQIVPASSPNRDRAIGESIRGDLLGAIGPELSRRLRAVGPVALDPEVARVKLQTNDGELSTFGRGTVFPIPRRMKFVRTATYWRTGPTGRNAWFDNGWNFCAKDWSPAGVCAWNSNRFHDAAAFSGDPTNSKELEGRACQMIDLYLDELDKLGVHYAVWTVLCYSRITFAQAIDVHAALQWGEDPQKGKLFEPSRCQLSFPLRGDTLTKYVAYIDLPRRELVYLDASLPARVSSAVANGKLLLRNMPAFCEYLSTLPSIHDLFVHARADASGMPVLYDDANRALTGGKPAYVFRPTNPDSSFTPFNPSSLL